MPSEPVWLTEARRRIGVREVVGPKHSSVIMGWIRRLGGKRLGIAVTDDETPWCGTFAADVMVQCGFEPPPVAVRASAWGLYGYGLKVPCPGAILVFKRTGGGHVGFYVGEDDLTLHVLGGNQGNAVSITRIERARCVAMRWPYGATDKPGLPVRVGKLASATPVSGNEA